MIANFCFLLLLWPFFPHSCLSGYPYINTSGFNLLCSFAQRVSPATLFFIDYAPKWIYISLINTNKNYTLLFDVIIQVRYIEYNCSEYIAYIYIHWNAVPLHPFCYEQQSKQRKGRRRKINKSHKERNYSGQNYMPEKSLQTQSSIRFKFIIMKENKSNPDKTTSIWENMWKKTINKQICFCCVQYACSIFSFFSSVLWCVCVCASNNYSFNLCRQICDESTHTAIVHTGK